MMSSSPNSNWIYAAIVGTLSLVMLAMVAALIKGFFTHDDPKAILAILGPAFQTVLGAFVGLLSAKFLHESKEDK